MAAARFSILLWAILTGMFASGRHNSLPWRIDARYAFDLIVVVDAVLIVDEQKIY